MNSPFFYCWWILLFIQIAFLINASDLYWILTATTSIALTIIIGVFYIMDKKGNSVDRSKQHDK